MDCFFMQSHNFEVSAFADVCLFAYALQCGELQRHQLVSSSMLQSYGRM
jgi:hypothetical protein